MFYLNSVYLLNGFISLHVFVTSMSKAAKLVPPFCDLELIPVASLGMWVSKTSD